VGLLLMETPPAAEAAPGRDHYTLRKRGLAHCDAGMQGLVRRAPPAPRTLARRGSAAFNQRRFPDAPRTLVEGQPMRS
jgi:hypothetical protein